MWLASIVSTIALAVIAEAPVAGPKLPELIATRQCLFAIPFRVARADDANRQPREVQLHVSGDRGSTWHHYTSIDPNQRQFLFRAACDGEYWFAVRTIDQSNAARPETITTPEMRVLIDTVPPKLVLSATAASDGRVVATWKFDEPQIKANAVTLQYRPGQDGPWQPVALDLSGGVDGNGLHSGQVEWRPAGGPAGDYQIRMEAYDLAGNPAVSHAVISFAQVQAAAAPPSAVSWPSESYPQAAGSPAAGIAANDPARPDAYVPAPAHPAVADNAAQPAQVRWINLRRFDLEYDVDPAAGAVQWVEIWATGDDGRSWQSIAVDDDRQSPVSISVPSDGVYGFRIAIGQAARPALRPQPGDRPELKIGVRSL